MIMKIVINSLGNWSATGLAVSSIATVAAALSGVFTAVPVVAQPAYGSYIGVGAAYGLSSGGAGEENGLGGVVTARYKFLELPVSVRAQLFALRGTTAFVPTVSYDIPIGWQTDAYVGVGASITDGTSPSPVGNRTAFVIQPGVDFAIPNSNVVIFANSVFAFNAFKGNGNTAISVQGGVGVQF